MSRLDSLLGVPICADECTSRQLRLSFAGLLVEMDVTKPLPTSIAVESPDGQLLEQGVNYEWAPPFLTTCNKVGHDCSKKAPVKKKTQWVPKAGGTKVPSQEPVAAQSGGHGGKKSDPVPVAQALVPVTTPAPVVPNHEDEGEWRVVARKSHRLGKRPMGFGSSNSYMVLIDEHEALEGGAGDGREGDDPDPASFFFLPGILGV